MRARIVRCDGSTELTELPGDSGGSLAAMYAAIGCHTVDVVRIIGAAPGKPGLDMWIDGEGLYTKSPNMPASVLASMLAGQPLRQWIAGDVIFTGGADSEGGTLPLTAIQDEIIADMVAEIGSRIGALV